MKLNWKKILSHGMALWAIIFIFITILVGFKLNTDNFFWWLITQVVAVFATLFMAKKLNLNKTNQAIMVGGIWVIVMLALDLLITTRFTTMLFFSSWKTWFGYLVVLILPIFTVNREKIAIQTK